MSRVGGKDTEPERQLRQALRAAKYKVKQNVKSLPGSPDVAIPSLRQAVFVHGCFWHGHTCTRGRRPSSNVGFWNKKLDGNRARDLRVQKELRKRGWSVAVIWQCELQRGIQRLMRKLEKRRTKGFTD